MQVLWAQQALRWSQSDCGGWLEVWVVDSLSKCDAAVWEAAKGALTASQQSEIEERRRGAVDQPRGHSARKQLEEEVAALSKLESAYQRQHKAAVDACVLLAETGGKVKEQKTRVQQASVKAALETSREAGAHHVGCGGDVATLLSLLAAALRKGQQQCYLPPGIRNQDLESFLVTLGQLHSFFPRPHFAATPRAQASQPAAPHNAVPSSIQATIPGFPGMAGGRADAGAVGLAHGFCGHLPATQPVGATPVAEGGERVHAWLSAYSACLSNSHSSSFAHTAFLTSQMRSPPPLTQH